MENKQLLEAQYENRASIEQHSIFIEAREWFDKSAGNSYWSARAFVDGESAGVFPLEYGYGQHSRAHVLEWLGAYSSLPVGMERMSESELREAGIVVYWVKSSVLKREMFKVGA